MSRTKGFLSRGWRFVAALVILVTAVLMGCTGRPEGSQPVKPFDIARYQGYWFEIMRLDHSFERGLTNVTARLQALAQLAPIFRARKFIIRRQKTSPLHSTLLCPPDSGASAGPPKPSPQYRVAFNALFA